MNMKLRIVINLVAKKCVILYSNYINVHQFLLSFNFFPIVLVKYSKKKDNIQ